MYMGLYENMARLKEVKLCNIVLVPSRLSASGRNKLHHHHHLLGRREEQLKPKPPPVIQTLISATQISKGITKRGTI